MEDTFHHTPGGCTCPRLSILSEQAVTQSLIALKFLVSDAFYTIKGAGS